MGGNAVITTTDVRSDISVTDVQSVVAATLLAAELTLDPDTLNRWIYNQFSFADSPAFGVGKNPEDTFTLSEVISSIGVGKGVSDSVSVTENISILLEILRAFTDALTFADSPALGVSPEFSDQQQISESDAKGVGLGKTDTYGISDAEVFAFGKVPSDQVSMSEVFSRSVIFSRAFSDAFSLDDSATVDAIRKDTANAKTNIFSFSDTEAFGVGKVFTDSFSLSEAIDSFDFGKGATDTVTVSENFSFALFSNAALNAAPLNQSPFNE